MIDSSARCCLAGCDDEGGDLKRGSCYLRGSRKSKNVEERILGDNFDAAEYLFFDPLVRNFSFLVRNVSSGAR